MTTPSPVVLQPPNRLLMGPGPSLTHPRVLSALAAPTVGHLDPYFLSLMDDLKGLLQWVFGTQNALTFPVSGTGSAGMEACLGNAVEPGDRVVICQNGVFGGRMAEIVRRLGGELVVVTAPWGEAIDPDAVAAALRGPRTKLVGIVHAETSTGVWQPLSEIAALTRQAGALLLTDCVTSLGGVPVEVDREGIDIAYSGTQKCLGCPPGLSPVTFSERAVDAIRARKTPVSSWYLDASLLLNYWGGERAYHHTAPINMLYGLHAALSVLTEEGLTAVYARHRLQHRALVAGLQAMGLRMLVPESLRLPQLNTVAVPDGIDDAAVRRSLLSRFNIEIGGGLGAFAGKAWRVGLMGHTARSEHVVTFLGALESVLGSQGLPVPRGAALAAATAVFDETASSNAG